MIYLGDTVHHDGHGNVPTYKGCDCGCDHDVKYDDLQRLSQIRAITPTMRDEPESEYWDKETYYETRTEC